MNQSSPLSCTTPSVHQQRGLSLLVALIALAAMSMAGVALIRSIDTNSLIAGNLAFRQNSTTSADSGVEAARLWLMNNSSAYLQDDHSDSGYFATRADTGGEDNKGMDITGSRTKSTNDNVKWIDARGDEQAGSHKPFCEANNDATGNRICYVIHRMCDLPGSIDTADCSTSTTSNSDGDSEGVEGREKSYQPILKGTGTTMGRYRITVRVSGPRNNNSYVQVFIQR
jgi:type IV pilus assembly protein PilX